MTQEAVGAALGATGFPHHEMAGVGSTGGTVLPREAQPPLLPWRIVLFPPCNVREGGRLTDSARMTEWGRDHNHNHNHNHNETKRPKPR